MICISLIISNSHVWMWELDCEESWAPKSWCFWTVVLEKTLESPLDCKEIQPVHPKGDQSWVFIGKTDAEAETPMLWPPHAKSWLIVSLEKKMVTHVSILAWEILCIEEPCQPHSMGSKKSQIWLSNKAGVVGQQLVAFRPKFKLQVCFELNFMVVVWYALCVWIC